MASNIFNDHHNRIHPDTNPNDPLISFKAMSLRCMKTLDRPGQMMRF